LNSPPLEEKEAMEEQAEEADSRHIPGVHSTLSSLGNWEEEEEGGVKG